MSVAVLLDNFIGASTQMELEERLRLTELKAREQQMRNPLESLLMKIAKEFSDSEDLSERLQKLYQVHCNKFSFGVSARIVGLCGASHVYYIHDYIYSLHIYMNVSLSGASRAPSPRSQAS